MISVSFENGGAAVRGAAFDAPLTLLESAQVFHWVEAGGALLGVAGGRPMRVQSDGDMLSVYPCAEEDFPFVADYFDLNRDYGAIRDEYARFEIAREAIDGLPGLRVLNQPPWEALFQFILSSNNNAARIRALVMKLSARFGEAHEIGGQTVYGIPSAETIFAAGVDALRDLGCGYRSEYLMKTAHAVADGFPLACLSTLTYEEAHAQLISLRGVGDKVADCALLFGCGHTSAFPVDVWVERLLIAWFPEHFASMKMTRKKKGEKARALLGKNAGLLQQFLFHSARCGLISLDGDEAV